MKNLKDDIDLWMRALTVGAFESGGTWLRDILERCVTIKNTRTAVPDYGFEWAIETLFGSFLAIRKEELGIEADIRINQPFSAENNKRYDLTFGWGQYLVVLELKTTTAGSLHWIKDDVNKPYPPQSSVYFLTVSYPYQGDTTRQHDGTVFVSEGKISCDYRYVLLRKTIPNSVARTDP